MQKTRDKPNELQKEYAVEVTMKWSSALVLLWRNYVMYRNVAIVLLSAHLAIEPECKYLLKFECRS